MLSSSDNFLISDLITFIKNDNNDVNFSDITDEIIERLNFSSTDYEYIAKVVTKKLYEMTSDLNIAIAGLIYTHSLLNNDCTNNKNIESSINLNLNIANILKSLKILSHCISKFQIKIKIKDNLNFSEGEKFRRLIFVVTRDIRALIIELVYRLVVIENLNSLVNLKNKLKDNFIIETFKIFVPIANRLGLWNLKWQLEDFSFRELEPEIYFKLANLLAETRAEREKYMNSCINEIHAKLLENNLSSTKKFEVYGRTKNIYSIYAKMKQLYCYSKGTVPSKLSSSEFNKFLYSNFNNCFESVYDLFGIRVICESIPDCYAALGIIHSLFPPAQTQRRKNSHVIDYIAAPKSNGYRSLHTVVTGPMQKRLEVQIRTYEMNTQAEYGIAAHWKYKELGHSQSTNKEEHIFADLKKLINEQGLTAVHSFLEGLDNDIFGDEIYVFTPKGDVISLPSNSTPVDFAYHIHTELGNKCAGAKINERMVSLSTLLQNGDIVNIIKQKNGHPSLDWLNFVRTNVAKNRIKQWYKRSRREEHIARGRELLEKELGKTGFDNLLRSQSMQTVAHRCNYQSVEDLFAGLGYGEITLNLVLNRWREITEVQQPLVNEMQIRSHLSPSVPKSSKTTSSASKTPIFGVEGLVYRLAGCCTPIPGDPIIGVVTRGRGITIHRQGCHNLGKVERKRLISVSWNPAIENSDRSQTYPVNVQIEALDRVGVLRDVLSELSDQRINVHHANVKTAIGQTALIELGLEIRDSSQLGKLFSQIKKMSDIINIRRLGDVDS